MVAINDWNDLDAIRNDLSASYTLETNLDASTAGYDSVASSTANSGEGWQTPSSDFTGTFNGQGFIIKDLYSEVGGIFNGSTPGSVIRDFGVFNVTINNTVGNTGPAANGARLEGDAFRIATSGTAESENSLGGIIGVPFDQQFNNNQRTKDSYSLTDVTNLATGDTGGAIGRPRYSRSETSYAAGAVSGSGNTGGFAGYDNGGNEMLDCYYDQDATGQTTDALSATGLSTSQMKGSAATTNLNGFDFTNVWETVEAGDVDTTADGYPILQSLDREEQLKAQGVYSSPLVSTGTATNIQVDQADVDGTLDDMDGNSSIDVYFQYREEGALTWSSTTAQTLSSTGSFSDTITGLSHDTTYEFRAVADDGSGTLSTASIKTFTTVTAVETVSSDNVQVDQIDLTGNLSSLLGESSADVYFEYRETGASTWQSTTTQTQSTTGNFTETVTGLSAATDYEFRAVATYSSGTYYGDTLTFTTVSDKDQYVGRFQASQSTGTQTVTMPFEPDVVQFIVTNTNSGFDTQNTYNGGAFGFSHGFSDAVNNNHVALCSASGSASTNGLALESSNTYSINMLDMNSDGYSITGRLQGYVASTSTGQFTMQWDSTIDGQYVIFRAFRFGSGEDFEVGTFNNPSATGTQKITTGFEPNFLMVKQTPRLENMTQTVTTVNNSGNCGFGHGWAAQNSDGSTSQSVQSVSMNANNINHHVFGAYDDRVIHTLWDTDTANASSIDGRVSANIDTWDGDGFTLNYTNVNPHEGTNHAAIYLAVNSGKTPEVGMGLTPTSASTQSITTNSRMDDIFTAMTPTNPGINQDGSSGDQQSENTHGWVFGGKNHTGDQMSMGYASNSNSVNDHRSMSSATDVLKQPHTDENANLHGIDEADVPSTSDTGFDLNWSQVVTSADGTAFDQTAYTYWSLGSSANTAPTVSNPVPSDGATDVSTSPDLSVDVSDADGDSMSVTFYDASDDSQIGSTQTGISDGGTATVTWSGLSNDIQYNWYVQVDDGTDTTISSTWSFTTTSAAVTGIAAYDRFKPLPVSDINNTGASIVEAQPIGVVGNTYAGFDGFESGSSQLDWESTSGFTIDANSEVYLNHTLQVSSSNEIVYNGLPLNESFSQDGKKATGSIKIDSQVGNSNDYIDYGFHGSDGGGTTFFDVAYVRFAGNGDIIHNGAVVDSWTTGNVYDLEIEFDFTNQDSTLLINGEVVDSDRTFGNGVGSIVDITEAYIYHRTDNSGGTVNAFFDRLTYTASAEDTINAGGLIGIDDTNVAGPSDIAAYDNNDNLIPYEIENEEDVTSSGLSDIVWIWAFPSVAGNWVRDGSEQIRLAYGDGPSSSEENVTSSWSDTIWDMAQHFSDDPLAATDSTSNDNDGTISGATATTDGEFNGAASFNGSSDTINVSSSSSLSMTSNSDVTYQSGVIETSSSTVQTVLDKPQEASLFIDNGGVKVASYGDNSGVIGSGLDDGAKHHVLGVHDEVAGEYRIYVDGSELAGSPVSTTDTSGSTSNAQDIGSQETNGTGNYFNGILDEVKKSVRSSSVSNESAFAQAKYDASPQGGQIFFTQGAAQDTNQPGSVVETSSSGVKLTTTAGVVKTDP